MTTTNRGLYPRRPGRLAHAFALLAPLLLLVGCITEPSGTTPVRVEYTSDFELTSDEPVVVRGLRFRAEPGDRQPSSIRFSISLDDREDPGVFGTRHDDVWVSVLDPETGRSLSLDPDGGIGHATVDGWDKASGTCEPTGCDQTWLVVARWLKPVAGSSVALRLGASMTAEDPALPWQSLQPMVLAEQSITDVPDLAFTGDPLVSSAQLGGSFRASPDWPGETHDFMLRVPAALVAAGDDHRRLGRILATFDATDRSGQAAGYATEFTVGTRTSRASAGPIALETDWLNQCVPGKTCELPVHLTLSWNPTDKFASPDPAASMTVDWTVVARLEDLGAGAIAPDELELIAVP